MNLILDFDLASLLINKLHFTYQEEWDCYLVKCEDEKTVWERFQDFLEDKNANAIQSKMRFMATKPDGAKSSCPKCQKSHPAEEECKSPKTFKQRKDTPTVR